MNAWYLTKVKYDCLVNGKIKNVSESYLTQAVDFGEAQRLTEYNLKKRIKWPDVDAMSKLAVDDVIFHKGTHDNRPLADCFYKIVIETGEKSTYLVPAKHAKEAIERALKSHGYGDDNNIVKAERTEILAVWQPYNEIWQGDWHNRMDLLMESKRHSWDLNQEEAFDKNGDATPPQTPPLPPLDQLQEGGPLFNVPNPNNVPAVINKGVATVEPTEVDAEDLENGYEPQEEIYEAKFIPQLGPGAPEETDDKDEEDLDTIGDPNERAATATRPKRKVNFFSKSDNKPGRRKPKPKA